MCFTHNNKPVLCSVTSHKREQSLLNDCHWYRCLTFTCLHGMSWTSYYITYARRWRILSSFWNSILIWHLQFTHSVVSCSSLKSQIFFHCVFILILILNKKFHLNSNKIHLSTLPKMSYLKFFTVLILIKTCLILICRLHKLWICELFYCRDFSWLFNEILYFTIGQILWKAHVYWKRLSVIMTSEYDLILEVIEVIIISLFDTNV